MIYEFDLNLDKSVVVVVAVCECVCVVMVDALFLGALQKTENSNYLFIQKENPNERNRDSRFKNKEPKIH